MFALSEDVNSLVVENRHFLKALTLIKPVINQEMLNYFENFSKKIEI
jgi:SpoVK/Ycf46/Vps4 family AAA+-type ATPase